MEPVFYESEEALGNAVDLLKSLGIRARKILAECVESQELVRSAVSRTALELESYGFVFIRDRSDVFHSEFSITPSLAGEEALLALDEQSSSSSHGR